MIGLWAPYAWLPDGIAEGVRLVAGDIAGRWTEVEAGVGPRSTDTVLEGLALPGFANAHSHAFHRGLRGRTHADGTFWSWREEMYRLAASLTPGSYYELARAVFAEMVCAGYTSVGEFHYLHHGPGGEPYEDPNAMGKALVRAARQAGIRLSLLDVCYLRGGLGDAGYQGLDETQRRFSDGSVAAWWQRVERLIEDVGHTNVVRVGVAAHSVRALDPSELAEFAAAHSGAELPVHLHLSEQLAENAAVAAVHGVSPTGLAERCGVLGPRTVAVHATHLSGEDRGILASTGTGVCFCPTTERDLADGIGDASALLEAGVELSIGSDQHAIVDPFDELRCLEGHERLVSHRRGVFSPAQLARAGFNHAAIGFGDCGRFSVGAQADLVMVDLGSVRTAGCAPDQIWHAASSSDVTDVLIAGRWMVRERAHRLGEVSGLLAGILESLR